MAGHRAAMALGQQYASALAEAPVRLARGGIDCVQPVAAVEEDAVGVAAAPVGDAAVLEAPRSHPLASSPVGLGIEDPQLGARLCVKGRHAHLHGGEVEDIADHYWRRLERARPSPVLLQGFLIRLPLPDDLEFADIGGRDLVSMGVLGMCRPGADMPPFGHAGRFLSTCEGAGDESGGRDESLHGRRSVWEREPGLTAWSSDVPPGSDSKRPANR